MWERRTNTFVGHGLGIVPYAIYTNTQIRIYREIGILPGGGFVEKETLRM